MELLFYLSNKFSKNEQKREFFYEIKILEPFYKDIAKIQTLDDNFQSSKIEGQL